MKQNPRTTWCVLDTSRTPSVIRCKHCYLTEAVQFPVDLTGFKKTIDRFLKEHRLCGLGLRELYARRKLLQERMENDLPLAASYAQVRKQKASIERTIDRLKKP